MYVMDANFNSHFLFPRHPYILQLLLEHYAIFVQCDHLQDIVCDRSIELKDISTYSIVYTYNIIENNIHVWLNNST